MCTGPATSLEATGSSFTKHGAWASHSVNGREVEVDTYLAAAVQICDHRESDPLQQRLSESAADAVGLQHPGRDRDESLPVVLTSFRAEVAAVEQPRIEK